MSGHRAAGNPALEVTPYRWERLYEMFAPHGSRNMNSGTPSACRTTAGRCSRTSPDSASDRTPRSRYCATSEFSCVKSEPLLLHQDRLDYRLRGVQRGLQDQLRRGGAAVGISATAGETIHHHHHPPAGRLRPGHRRERHDVGAEDIVLEHRLGTLLVQQPRGSALRHSDPTLHPTTHCIDERSQRHDPTATILGEGQRPARRPGDDRVPPARGSRSYRSTGTKPGLSTTRSCRLRAASTRVGLASDTATTSYEGTAAAAPPSSSLRASATARLAAAAPTNAAATDRPARPITPQRAAPSGTPAAT